ncbi:MAG TPA: Asp-tRNA(Asn)/Glu-tRNA(Gln) amidotransferase subunit GatC [Gemmatimonas sp.]|uniref:Asp-tRNA(Asn)/Glu-tRNA(Gln) amidotransferase subunit GatC n=1 Tax=Gemmatimonas sp. TaxID=1962908 RepID=UPI002EDA6C4E
MSVTPEDVRHVATLARLGLSEGQIPALVQQLNGILGHMDVLQQVDVSGVPLTPPDQAAPLRPDARPADVLLRSREAFAPAMRDGFFLVPRLTTHGAQGASADEGDAA